MEDLPTENNSDEEKQLRDLFAQADKITLEYGDMLKKAFRFLILKGQAPAPTIATITMNALAGTILGLTKSKKDTRDILMQALAHTVYSMAQEQIKEKEE